MASTAATTISRSAIEAVPMASHMPLCVISVMLTPKSARTSPTSAARSSSRITGNSGTRARRTNSIHDALPRILGGEHATDEEDDDGHHKRVDVALAPVAERVSRRRLPRRAPAADQQQH